MPLGFPETWNPASQVDFGYSIGFFDGEGSVAVRITKDTGRNYRIRMLLTITQKQSRVLALKTILKLFGCGSIYNQNKDTLEFRVVSLQSVKFLCELLLLGSLVKRQLLLLLRNLTNNYATLVDSQLLFGQHSSKP